MLFCNRSCGVGVLQFFRGVIELSLALLTGYSHACWNDHDILEVCAVGTYCYWFFYLVLLVLDIGTMLTSEPQLPGERVSSKQRQRWERRHRRKKPPFYCRNLQRYEQHPCTEGVLDEDHLLFDYPYWKLLHLVGDECGREFDELCAINPDIVELFGMEEKFNVSSASKMQQHSTASFGFTVDNMFVDMTKVVDAGHVGSPFSKCVSCCNQWASSCL